MFEVWVSGCLVCIGIASVWGKEWYVKGESKIKFAFGVMVVCAMSWVAVGVVLGRMAEALLTIHDNTKK